MKNPNSSELGVINLLWLMAEICRWRHAQRVERYICRKETLLRTLIWVKMWLLTLTFWRILFWFLLNVISHIPWFNLLTWYASLFILRARVSLGWIANHFQSPAHFPLQSRKARARKGKNQKRGEKSHAGEVWNLSRALVQERRQLLVMSTGVFWKQYEGHSKHGSR